MVLILLASIAKSEEKPTADLFKIEPSELIAFNAFNELELLLSDNDFALNELSRNMHYSPVHISHDGPLDIPSFWFAMLGSAASCLFPGLGCIGGPVAAIIIQTQTDDPLEISKAWKGCLIGNLATTVPYAAVAALFLMY